MYRFLIGLLFFIPSFLSGRPHVLFYQAVVLNDKEMWKNELDRLSNNPVEHQDPDYMEYLFGYIGWCIREADTQEASHYLQQMKHILPQINLSTYERMVYESAIGGFEILLKEHSPLRSGPKSIRCANKALKLEPDNPFAYIQKGNIVRFMPSLLGGSLEKAIGFYQKAEMLYQKKNMTQPNWMYLYLLCTIYECYREKKDVKGCEHYGRKIHLLEPKLSWILEE